jgi:hypothetical protein
LQQKFLREPRREKREIKIFGQNIFRRVQNSEIRLIDEASVCPTEKMMDQDPILRLWNLQRQRQRCSRQGRFSEQKKIFFISKRNRLLVAL